MSFLLDTTALSELTRKKPNHGFLEWLRSQTTAQTFIGAPSIGEIEIGISLLDRSSKRRALESWLEKLVREFEKRILPFDTAAARVWGRAIGRARKAGRTLPGTDSQIAAIAAVAGLAVVTRNGRHFRVEEFQDVHILNPWS